MSFTMNTIPLQAGHDVMPTQKPHQWSWAASQSLAILAVDNIRPSKQGIELLQAIDRGEITPNQAIEAILQRAANYVSHQKK